MRYLNIVFSTLLTLLACTACTDDTTTTTSSVDPDRGPISKADRAGSCENRCGSQDPGGSCWCDSQCAQYGDCCNDITAWCGGGAPTNNNNNNNMPMNTPTSVPEFGSASRTFTVIADASDGLSVPRDLEFNPQYDDELWVINRSFDGTATIFNTGGPDQQIDVRADAFGNHFMEEPSALSFGDNGAFATAQESRNTYNGQGFPNDFMGPTLWPSDLSIYAAVNQDGPLGGSHLDMLHQSPLGMGIAHEKDNVYWYFDGMQGDIVRYDFQVDHGPGYDDHSDGIVRRYPEVSVRRTPDVPSHLYLDKPSGWLYIADTGNGRVLRLDVGSGQISGRYQPRNEPLQEYSRVTGVTAQIFASGLSRPSGIEFHSGRLFVSDNGTGEVIAFDMNGNEIDRLDTDTTGLMGITFGPEGKLYYVDANTNRVIRVNP